MLISNYIRIVLLVFVVLPLQGICAEREDEIREKMWGSPGEGFEVSDIPKKWADKSAVFIARLNHFEYKKPPILNVLKFNEYNHYRIKLLDKSAIENYAEISYMNSMAVAGLGTKIYVGIKVIKPDGREVIVDLSNAVKMEQKAGLSSKSYNKIAIPDLQPGDILDYYICEESVFPNSSEIYFFDPVLFHLPQRYPVMKQKLQFNVQRRCFINLKSLNGAPELKLVDDVENDEQYYLLEDNDREALEETRWLYPYRELPSVKFRASYASGKGIRRYGVLLGEPGIVKSSVDKQELVDLTHTLLTTTISNFYELSKYAKTELKGMEEKDPLQFAREIYYYYRSTLIQEGEVATLNENNPFFTVKDLKFTDTFRDFLTYKKISHDIILAIPRNISSIDNILLENELNLLIRVKKGNDYLYLSPPDLNTKAGEIDVMLEGTEAYALDGLNFSKKTVPVLIKLPESSANDNQEQRTLRVSVGEDMKTTKITATNLAKGSQRSYAQQTLIDIYDIIDEDDDKYEIADSFENYMKSAKKKYTEVKESYLGKRDEMKKERLKAILENNFDFKINNADSLIIEHTGRYHDKPDMTFSFSFETEELINKAGKNYLMDVGKLIEGQVKIDGSELNRAYNIYMDNARSYKLMIHIEIPKGYTVQGIEKLNQHVQNDAGGFISSAKITRNTLIIDTYKFYNSDFVKKEDWPKMIDFLNAAHNFMEQKLLFKKG